MIQESVCKSSPRSSKSIGEPSPIVEGKEYPLLLGQKVNKPAPEHPGPLRFYNFQEEAYKHLNDGAKKKVDDRRKKSGNTGAGSAMSSSSSSSSSSSGGGSFLSSSSSVKASSSSVVALSNSMATNLKASSKNDEDSGDDDDPMSGVCRGYDHLDESDEVFDDAEEEAALMASILLGMKTSMNQEAAAPKDDGGSAKRPKQSRGRFVIPEYHSTSKSDDAEGVDTDNYDMSVLQIDESLFGRRKYHKGKL